MINWDELDDRGSDDAPKGEKAVEESERAGDVVRSISSFHRRIEL